ncbi:MAG: CheR family methyltransferase [Thermovenabulum sp.]|uniref:CheR family methyltransferase n=1 Tax=Thermovenabulum sp. TaxID=3100335 RepID=UPI003C7C8936
MQLDMEQFKKIRDLINSKSGIFLEDKKMYFLEKRIEDRMKEMDVDNIDEYINYLKFYDNGTEIQKLIEKITINETYFFREFEQLQAFAEECLPEVERFKNRIRDRNIRVWSAGCSTGEEPYTISIILHEMLENPDLWNIYILGTDINGKVLEVAKKGVYDERVLKHVAKTYVEKYFDRIKYNVFKVRDFLKEKIEFVQSNILDMDKKIEDDFFDFIFCRNVLIYFDDNSRKKALDIFYKKLKSRGFILLGHSESVGRITDKFNYRKMRNYYVYQKP